MVEDDLRLSLGQFVQVERTGKPGDDLVGDVDGNDPAQCRLILERLPRGGLADQVTVPGGAEQGRSRRRDFCRRGPGFRSDHDDPSGDASSTVHDLSAYHLVGDRPMATEERAAVSAGVRELRERVRGLEAAIAGLSPAELSSRWWGGDPEASPRLRTVAERLDDCLARFDALQRSLGLPADVEPRYGRFFRPMKQSL
jgi:hypothetical protein